MFVILDIKFRVANFKWNLLISRGYYLLNWPLPSLCSCFQKVWILFTVYTCRAVVRSFQNLVWPAMTLLFTAQVILRVCMACMILFHAVNLKKLSNLKKYLNLGVLNLKVSFVLLGIKHLSHNIFTKNISLYPQL